MEGFVTFSRAMGNWWGNPYISHMLKYTTGWGSNGKKHPYHGKSMGINFPGFAHLMVFTEFSYAIESWLENLHISHVMKSTIGWESNRKKAPIPWEKCYYQFLRSSPYNGFCWIFSCYGKLMGKPMCFSYTTGWELNGKKAPLLWEKYEYQFPRSALYDRFCCIFPNYGKLIEKPMDFPYDEVYHRMGIEGKKVPILWEKYDY